jgi:hypothetical protein
MVDSFNKWLGGQSHYRIVADQGSAGQDMGGRDGIDR